MDKTNAITARINKLSNQWGQFALKKQARIMCWLLLPDERRMADGFLALEGDEQAGAHPDVFIAFRTPFSKPTWHGLMLRNELVNAFREGKEQLEKDGVDTSWRPPEMGDKDTDTALLIRACASLYKHLKLTRYIVLVLQPEAVDDFAAYQAWLHQWSIDAPAEQRVLVLGDASHPEYESLAQREKKRVWMQKADLDMPSALQELSQNAGNLDTPGGGFRDLFVRMGNALGKQELERALVLGDSALKVVALNGWYHMAVPIHLALAASLAGAGRSQEAIERYVAAEKSATTGEEDGEQELRPTCKILRMQSRLGRGSALIAAQQWDKAAELFEQTAPMAAELRDKRATLDCYRLASFCHAQSEQADRAWDDGMLGLQVAREMDEETRKTSTFPYLGEGLMRLCESDARKSQASETEQEISTIAGTTQWRPKPVEVKGNSAGDGAS